MVSVKDMNSLNVCPLQKACYQLQDLTDVEGKLEPNLLKNSHNSTKAFYPCKPFCQLIYPTIFC